VRLREKYCEGEVPYEAKTGSGPMLLTCSYPYIRDWLNEHPSRNNLEARLICNLHNGAPVKPESMWSMMKQLRGRIARLLDKGEITDPKEREILEYRLRTKKWNPYEATPLHVRIIAGENTFNDTGRDSLSLAFDQIARKK
jgi:integrase/recombinase XerD